MAKYDHVLIGLDGLEVTSRPSSPPPPPPSDAAARVRLARAREHEWHRAARAAGDELVVSLRPGDRPEHELLLARLRRALGEQP